MKEAQLEHPVGSMTRQEIIDDLDLPHDVTLRDIIEVRMNKSDSAKK